MICYGRSTGLLFLLLASSSRGLLSWLLHCFAPAVRLVSAALVLLLFSFAGAIRHADGVARHRFWVLHSPCWEGVCLPCLPLGFSVRFKESQ